MTHLKRLGRGTIWIGGFVGLLLLANRHVFIRYLILGLVAVAFLYAVGTILEIAGWTDEL